MGSVTHNNGCGTGDNGKGTRAQAPVTYANGQRHLCQWVASPVTIAIVNMRKPLSPLTTATATYANRKRTHALTTVTGDNGVWH